MGKTDIADIAGKMVKLLQPLSSEDRHRVVKGSMTLLGEVSSLDSRNEQGGAESREENAAPLSSRARMWMKQNQISLEKLQEAFQIENGQAEVILSDIPGGDKREKTRNAYVLTGVANYLTQDSPTFTDAAARALCESSGCYDKGNHATALRGKGNLFAGSKEKGWTVTGPGLKHAATLIKGLGQ